MISKFIHSHIHKALGIGSLQALIFTAALGSDFELSRLGMPYKPGDISVAWDATNRLPASCAINRVVARKFDTNLISALLELSGFTEQERTPPLGTGVFRDRDVVYYRTKESSKYLGFIPSQGWIIYKNSNAESAPKEQPEGVPSLDEALVKSEALLTRLGIKREDLAIDPTSGKPDYVHAAIERSSPKTTNKQIVTRYLFFRRLHEGISFHCLGLGGIRIGYGNQGQVSELEIVCRAVRPLRAQKIAEPRQITDWIKSGRAVVSSEMPEGVHSLRIKNAEIRYLEYQGYERQKNIYPFAYLNGIAENGQTNIYVTICCPLFHN
jgi:hypothetical protein